MSEIEYRITEVYSEHGRFVICSHTAWLGKLSLSKEEFEEIGRPTVGDTLILSLCPSNQSTNKVIE